MCCRFLQIQLFKVYIYSMDNINLRLEELNDKPDIRELTLRNGIYYPSDEELIMLILGRGTRKNPIELLSQEVIDMLNASNDENLIQNLVSIEGMEGGATVTRKKR